MGLRSFLRLWERKHTVQVNLCAAHIKPAGQEWMDEAPCHCPTCFCPVVLRMSQQKLRCSDADSTGGDFVHLPTGSPSSQLCIRSATRANLLLMSSSVSRTTLSTCKWALPAKPLILPRRAESSSLHQLALMLQLCKESGFPGSLCRVLEGQRFPFSALDAASLSLASAQRYLLISPSL